MKKIKTISILLLSFFMLMGSAFAQEDLPGLPHVVEGEIEVAEGPFNEDGEVYTGTVYAVKGEEYASRSVEDGIFNDLLAYGLEDGEEFNLRLGSSFVISDDASEKLPIEFSSGSSTDVGKIKVTVDDLNADIDPSETTIDEGDTVDFDGSGSGSTGIVSYEWDFDTGDTESGEDVDYTFDDEGDYDVVLEVSDEAGNTATDSVTIEVNAPDTGNNIGGGGGGGVPPPEDTAENETETNETEEEETEINETEAEGPPEEIIIVTDSESPVDIDAEQGQKVNIDVSGTDMRISFLSTGSQTITGNITSVDREDIDIETSDNQIDFREIDIEGEIEDSNITFSVAKDRLDEEDAEPSQVYLQRYDPEDNEWEDLDTFILEEQEEKYMFEAEVPEFSLFATAFRTTTEETEDTKPPEQDTGRQASPLTGLAIDDLGQGSLIVTIIVALLFALLITDRQMGGMPWQNRIKRARNIHKRAERIYKAGNKEKAVRLYHKARRLRR